MIFLLLQFFQLVFKYILLKFSARLPAGFLVSATICNLPAFPSTSVSALNLLLLMHNSSVSFHAFMGTKTGITLVAEIRQGVTFCVFFQVRLH